MTARVHGMDGSPAEPVWAPLTDAEARTLLDRYGVPGAAAASVEWVSPRPMSAAGIVAVGAERLFVKRHSPLVRPPARLATEHDFGDWLRRRGIPVPEVLVTPDGEREVETAGGVYEVQEVAAGSDRYRDAMSWTPYDTTVDAFAAGAALARFHQAAAGFDRSAHPWGPLTDSAQIVTSPDPMAALEAVVRSRPVLSEYLAGRDWASDAAGALAAPLEEAARAGLATAEPLWTHGDWHPSNLTWSATSVVGVLDLGLANRTYAVHDIAVAIERSCVNWLAGHGAGSGTGPDASTSSGANPGAGVGSGINPGPSASSGTNPGASASASTNPGPSASTNPGPSASASAKRDARLWTLSAHNRVSGSQRRSQEGQRSQRSRRSGRSGRGRPPSGQLPWTVDREAVRALLDGYESVRPLTQTDRRHLDATLPVAHVEYALSEIEYFAGPAGRPADADLAYGPYLLDHAEFLHKMGRIGQNML